MSKMTIEEARYFMRDPEVQEAADTVLESLCGCIDDDDPIGEELDRWCDVFNATSRNSKKTWLAFEPQASDEFIIALAEHAEKHGTVVDGDWMWIIEDEFDYEGMVKYVGGWGRTYWELEN